MDFLKWSAYELSERPKNYGLIHIIFIVVMIVSVALMIWKIKKIDNRRMDKIVLTFGIILFVIEIYKQLVYTFVDSDGSYQWYAFPFQFCSSPMYVCLILPFIKNDKIKNALYGYLAFFGTIGGLVVMIYPNDVWVRTLSISLHSMIWHSSMVVLGVFILAKKNYETNIKQFFPAIIVFVIFVLLAQTLNISFYHLFIKDLGQTFNMFFISPYFECTLPVFNIFYNHFGWIICMILYVLAFSIGTVVVYYILRFIKKLGKLIKE